MWRPRRPTVKPENETIRLAIREAVGFAVQRFNLWGAGHVVSPELFRRIEIPAGRTGRWSRSCQVLST
jgi:hypothetical protein